MIATILEVLVVTGEIGKHGSIIELCRALIGPSVQAMELSLIAAYVVTDTGRIIVVLAKSLEDWYKNWQKRRIENARAKGRAEGRAVGEAKGRAENHASMG